MSELEEFRKAGCTGKKVYSFARAKSLARAVSQRHDEPMEHYHCTWCHGWHIGRSSNAGRRRKKAAET